MVVGGAGAGGRGGTGAVPKTRLPPHRWLQKQETEAKRAAEAEEVSKKKQERKRGKRVKNS